MSNESSQERISQKLSQNTENKSKNNVVAIVVCFIVAVIIVAALVLVLTRQSADAEKRNVVVTPDNVEEVLSDMQNQQVQLGTYEVTMNTTWNFDKGDAASSNAYVENSTSNTNDVYFDIVRSDTQETIYESPIIPLGSHLENITLDTPLDKGTYSCVLTYHLLDDNDKPISKLNINLSIVIAN
ncbi:MAG: hypothetical protein NC300_09520 [Bacteroidales bacterium]|nr:hypothetical protein [Clostridium sp.]MCM1204370.1 hypothetical protein [Bacteroidales bacterium]